MMSTTPQGTPSTPPSPPSPPPLDALRDLGEQLSDPSLKSSARVLILISLALNRKMSFVSLLSLTGVGKGSLSNHLERLELAGYVTTKTVKTWGGYRTTVEITPKGIETYNTLLRALASLQQAPGGQANAGT
jgi:DNA-binding MarR family transcriptional regulator